MKVSKKLVLILIGPPGAGKGTQGQLLAEEFGLYYFDTSKMLEEEFKKENGKYKIEGKIYQTKEEKKLWLEGKLCSPPFVTYLMQKKIKTLAKREENILFPGSPRTLYEAERILPLLEKLYGKENIKIILLQISEKESLFRNSHRRICQLMRHPILYSKETKKLKKCPLDGSPLVKRKGLDEPETIKVRLKEYRERTFPIIKYFQKRKLPIIKINASPPPSIVFKEIIKKIK